MLEHVRIAAPEWAEHQRPSAAPWLDRLLVGDTSGRWLTLAAGIPVLLSVWLLVAPGVVLSREMTWDLLFNLAGAWHTQSGHVPHVDFHDPLGPLVFQLTRLGFWVLGARPAAFLVGELIVVAGAFAAAVLAATPRLPRLAALVFVLYTVLLVVMPVSAGDDVRAYSFAMSYNRWGWSALTTLCLVLFVAPRRPRPVAWLDPVLSGLLILFALYLKITFALAGLGAVVFAVLAMEHVRTAWRRWTTVIATGLVIVALPFNYPYFADVTGAATSGYVRTLESGRIAAFLMNNRAEFALYASAILLLTWLWRRGWAHGTSVLAALAVMGVGAFALATNAQAGNVPVGVVVAFLIYNAVRTAAAGGRGFRSSDRAVALGAVLMWPLFSVAAELVPIVGYAEAAMNERAVFTVNATNLRGLAVPTDDTALDEALAPTGYRLFSTLRPLPQRSPLTQFEYVQTLLEAAALFQGDARGRLRILVLDQVNPLPFMLGYPPPRGRDLWIWRETLPRRAEEVFGDVDVVLVPKYATDASATIVALAEYGDYFTAAFPAREETRSWTVLSRRPPRDVGDEP